LTRVDIRAVLPGKKQSIDVMLKVLDVPKS
jgi:hypothetical protein